MKALVLCGINDLRLMDMPKPTPARDEVLVRTRASTICTSDINDIKGNPFGISLPIIIGHEGAGEIEAMGEDVHGFHIGDAVTAHPVIPCGKCESCRRGLSHLCDDMDHLGVYRNGSFAEYFTIRADRIRPKPAALSFAQATLMEPVCVCVEALHRANICAGANVLVVGDGPFGIAIARLAQAWQPRRVVLLGRHEYRLAQANGAIAINQRRAVDVQQAISEATDGQGIDCAVLAVGTAEAVDICIEALRSRGTLAVFSGIPGKTPVDLWKLHIKELNICGSCNDMDCLDEALEKLGDPALNLLGLITHKFKLDNWAQAFELAQHGKDSALKVTIEF